MVFERDFCAQAKCVWNQGAVHITTRAGRAIVCVGMADEQTTLKTIRDFEYRSAPVLMNIPFGEEAFYVEF